MDGTVKKRDSQGRKQEARGLLGPGKRFIMRVFFVFSFSQGTFLGPRFHLSSKVIPRWAFPSKSSILPVIWLRGTRKKLLGPKNFHPPSVPESTSLPSIQRPSPALDGPAKGGV